MNRRNFCKRSLTTVPIGMLMPSIFCSDNALTLKESWFCKGLAPDGRRILETEGKFVWGCSPIYDDTGKIHVFFSIWPDKLDNWLTNSEIWHAVADHPFGPYTNMQPVLKARGKGFWDANSVYNPTVYRVGKKYVLLYTGSDISKAENWRDKAPAANTQRTGMAVSDSLYGPWEVNHEPVLAVSENKQKWDSYCIVNPAFIEHPGGQYWLYYRSWDRYNDERRKIGVAFANKLQGPYTKYEKNPIIDFSSIGAQCEDPYFFHYKGKFHCLVRDMGVVGYHNGLYLCSDDGLNWSDPQLGYSESSFYFGGKPERFERPQILWKDGRPEYLFNSLTGGKYHTSSGSVIHIKK